MPSGNVSFNTISVNGRYELFSIVKVKVLESLLQYMPEGGAILVNDKEYGQEQPSLNLLAGVCVSAFVRSNLLLDLQKIGYFVVD